MGKKRSSSEVELDAEIVLKPSLAKKVKLAELAVKEKLEEENKKPDSNKNTHRSWCGTLNNPMDHIIQTYKHDFETLVALRAHMDKIFSETPAIRYSIIGIETGEREKTQHLQAYFEFNGPIRMTGVVEILRMAQTKGWHLEPRRGTRDEARDYCNKDKDFTETGTWIRGPGARSDIESLGMNVSQRGSDWIALNTPGRRLWRHTCDHYEDGVSLCHASLWTEHKNHPLFWFCRDHKGFDYFDDDIPLTESDEELSDDDTEPTIMCNECGEMIGERSKCPYC